MKRIFALTVSLCLIIGSFAGCSKIDNGLKAEKFDEKAQADFLQTGVVAEAGEYTLNWDNTTKQVTLVDKKNNVSWSSNPSQTLEPQYDEFGMPIKTHPLLNSDIAVKYVDEKTGNIVSVNSYSGANSSGRISAKSVTDGIKITYYFDELKFAIPVEYKLYDDGLKVTIKTKEIQEEKNRITEISVLPFMCSVGNTSLESYLFVPSGSGALIYPKEISSSGESFRQEIYGEDLMIRKYVNTSNKENIYIPVFGIKNGNRGLCAIIENGAESCLIEGSVGSQVFNYSSLYATLCIRGYDELRSVNYSGATLVNDYYTSDMADLEFGISYKPIYNNDANYIGMAKTYREYLIENEGLKKNKGTDSTYSVTINGGFLSKKSFLGIPYETLYSLTTLEQAEEIVKQLLNETGQTSTIRLKGYGDTGLNIGKLSGGYKINSALGGLEQFKVFNSYCKKNGIDTYLNFDILRFSSGGNGWSKLSDSAKSATGKSYYPSGFTIAMRDKDITTEYALISRDKIVDSTKKLLDKTKKWDIDGYSLDTVGRLAYSDYGSVDNHSKSNLSQDISNALSILSKQKQNIAVSGANAYAAVKAHQIFDVPLSSARFDIFDEDIPFYQIVFKGYVSFSSSPINHSTLQNDALLACIESATIPSWSLMYEYDNAALDFASSELHNGVFSQYKDDIVEVVNNISLYYNSIKNAEIIEHTVNKNGIRITKFSNDIVAIVNRGSEAVITLYGTLGAGEYVIRGLND